MKTQLTQEQRSLLKAQAECSARFRAASEAVEQAETALDAVLVAAGDSSSARRVLHEAKRLQVAAQTTLENIAAEIQNSAAALIQKSASVRTSAAENELTALLSKFNPSFNQETHAHEHAI